MTLEIIAPSREEDGNVLFVVYDPPTAQEPLRARSQIQGHGLLVNYGQFGPELPQTSKCFLSYGVMTVFNDSNKRADKETKMLQAHAIYHPTQTKVHAHVPSQSLVSDPFQRFNPHSRYRTISYSESSTSMIRGRCLLFIEGFTSAGDSIGEPTLHSCTGVVSWELLPTDGEDEDRPPSPAIDSLPNVAATSSESSISPLVEILSM